MYVQKMAVDRARSGEIGIRPSERRRQVEEAQLAAGGGGGYGAPKADGYGVYTPPDFPDCRFMLLLQFAGVKIGMRSLPWRVPVPLGGGIQPLHEGYK